MCACVNKESKVCSPLTWDRERPRKRSWTGRFFVVSAHESARGLDTATNEHDVTCDGKLSQVWATGNARSTAECLPLKTRHDEIGRRSRPEMPSRLIYDTRTHVNNFWKNRSILPQLQTSYKHNIAYIHIYFTRWTYNKLVYKTYKSGEQINCGIIWYICYRNKVYSTAWLYCDGLAVRQPNIIYIALCWLNEWNLNLWHQVEHVPPAPGGCAIFFLKYIFLDCWDENWTKRKLPWHFGIWYR